MSNCTVSLLIVPSVTKRWNLLLETPNQTTAKKSLGQLVLLGLNLGTVIHGSCTNE